MKKFIASTVLALITFMLALSLPAQVTVNTTGTFDTAASVVVTNATTRTLTSTAVNVRPRGGIAIVPQFACSGVDTTGTIVCKFDVSVDGSTWSTTGPLSTTTTLNGTNTVIAYYVIAETSLSHAQKIRLRSIQNTGTNDVTVASVTYAITQSP